MVEKWERCWEGKLTMPEKWLVEELRHLEDRNIIATVLLGDLNRLQEARAKHPKVGENVYHALGALSAEHGEATQEIVKSKPGWEGRMDDELRDERVVALRISLREYGNGEGA